jgi:hypothetical protein
MKIKIAKHFYQMMMFSFGYKAFGYRIIGWSRIGLF